MLPDYRRRGIGTALAGWMDDAARKRGYEWIGGPRPEGSDGERLLAKLGYRRRWTSWVLQLPEGATIPHREVPPGYAIREATPEDYEATWNVVEDAFLEWSVRERESFEDFLAVTVRRPGHEPWMLRVVTDPAGEIVGTACSSWPGTRSRRRTSSGSRSARTSEAGGWPRRCWSTRSRKAASTAHRARASRPTPAPAR